MLFKKTARSFLNKEVGNFEEPTPRHIVSAFTPTTSESIARTDQPQENEAFVSSTAEPEEIPDVYLGPEASLQGELEFSSLLRIDGKFEGTINSSGRIIVGPQGHVKANLRLTEAFISGKIEGDIFVKERLVLRGRAEIYGNITAPIISVDEGVTIVGQLCVSTKNNESNH